VSAGQVRVYGTVKGNIAGTRRVEVRDSAHVKGDIRSPDIHIDDGANFKGNVSP
jgi:cytoskeletal protein CcmA (bactofilin family)